MSKWALRLSAIALLTAMAGTVSAQTTVTLPYTSPTTQTIVTATVSEQAQITLPTAVAFAVSNTAVSTNATAVSVTVNNIVLASSSKKLKLSIEASAANFTPPNTGDTTWAAGDISWVAGTWTNATGAAGTLSNTAFNEIATSDAGVASMSTTGLTFTLAAKSSVQRSGAHTLTVTWKVESI
jgi:hypothetical protein